MDLFLIQKRYKIKKERLKSFFFYLIYKSEKSLGNQSEVLFIDGLDEDVVHQNTLFHISSIFSNILWGFAYLSTSNPSKEPKIGNKNIVKTVTTIPITAYLIVLIAGFILSSFQPDKTSKSHHHNINIIDNTHASNTNIEIANNMKSQNDIVEFKILSHEVTAYACWNIIISF